MAVYFVTGKLGSGKTLAAVQKIKEYLSSGRRVATNLDIFPEHLVMFNNKNSITRLPDKPRPIDLELMGTGDNNHWTDNKTYDESKFGCLVLDECATWLNARAKKDEERTMFIDYLLHSRKYRWDIYFLVQDEKAIDRQILDALCEFHVEVKRMDRVSIPFFTSIIGFLSFGLLKVRLPKVHLAVVRYGISRSGMLVERWWAYGSALFDAYRTGQVFSNDSIYFKDDLFDMRATYTTLSAWHVHGRYREGWKQRFLRIANILLNKSVSFFLKTNDRAVASSEDEKQINMNKSYLGKTISNEDTPLLINPDNLYLFPEIKTEGLPWNFIHQAD